MPGVASVTQAAWEKRLRIFLSSKELRGKIKKINYPISQVHQNLKAPISQCEERLTRPFCDTIAISQFMKVLRQEKITAILQYRAERCFSGLLKHNCNY